MATLRQQLMLKRSLRRLRTWAPPTSIGLFVGAGVFLLAERLVGEPANQPPAEAAAYLSYASCEAARAEGAAPLHRGQPGYNRRLDPDRDGVACEPPPPR